MSNSTTVDLLIDMARKKRDDAAARMAEAQAGCAETEKKLVLLNQYLSDYQARQRTTSSTDAVVLANFRAFLEKLESAVTHQHGAVQAARRTALQARQVWEQALQHYKAIELLQERRASTARATVVRAMQKTHDEQAARMASYPMAMALAS
jgi:flagellar FliJ protein